jgi:hypothetical protein
VVDVFFANARNGQDQLRQCIIGALSEILVVSIILDVSTESAVRQYPGR